MSRQLSFVSCLSVVMASCALAQQEKNWNVPGEVQTTWIGNTFNGYGEHSHVGRWVQNKFDDIEVSPDGTVVSAATYEENGRCTSLYKDGDLNTTKFRQYNGKGGHKAWGWGTASRAAALWEDEIFIANTNGDLMRFRWKPGERDSQTYIDQTRYIEGSTDEKLSKEVRQSGVLAIGLTASDGRLALLRDNGEIVFWDITDGFKQTGSYTLDGARDVALTADGTLWAVDGDRVMQVSETGRIVRSIDEPGKPTRVDIAPDGQVVVCDNGPRQQVLVYDVSGEPRLVKVWGREGGLRAGTPGEVASDKFYSMRGANLDDKGNLYVAMSIGKSLAGGTCLRSIDPNSDLRWQLWSLPAVNVFDVDPVSDGRTLYGPNSIITLNEDAPQGEHWSVKAITVDGALQKGRGSAALLRRVKGKRLLATIGQMAGGPKLYAFPDEESHLAEPVGHFDGGWAWYVDEEGGVWHGDPNEKTARRTIQHWPFQGWNDDGTPRYDRENPDAKPWPEGFEQIKRIVYVPDSDTLYVSGYTPGVKPVSWGYMGSVLARYDNWVHGNGTQRWRIKLPHDSVRSRPGGAAPPKTVDVAGDYIFTAFARPAKLDDGRKVRLCVYVFRADDGEFVGAIWAPERFGPVGWVDMKHGLNAYQRDDGRYMLTIEEQYRGKNLVYLWTPPES